jgi:molybdenum cofactor cytidylyltransferase
MKFGSVPLEQAHGARLAHTHRLAGRTLKKGAVLDDEALAALRAAGHTQATVAILDADEIDENEAAARIATALAGAGLDRAPASTGRADLHAATDGLLSLDRNAIERINLIDDAITVATLPPDAMVTRGQVVATIKIIPFAVQRALLADLPGPALEVRKLRAFGARLIQTESSATKPSVLDKTRDVTAARLAALGSTLLGEARCAHEAGAIAQAIAAAQADLILVVGASSIVDRRDAIPAAIESAGGTVERFGLPVEPGNLLLVGRLGAIPVIGLPGCARSPALNGIDLVLRRIAADLPLDRGAIARMGVGGLLA